MVSSRIPGMKVSRHGSEWVASDLNLGVELFGPNRLSLRRRVDLHCVFH